MAMGSTHNDADLTVMSEQAVREMVRWLDAFESGWTATSLDEQTASIDANSSWRQPALIEAVKIDLQRQWQNGSQLSLESYFDRFPEIATNSNGFIELVACEYRLRAESDRPASMAEFLQRFPDRQEELTIALSDTAAETLPESRIPFPQSHGNYAHSTASEGQSTPELETSPNVVVARIPNVEEPHELETDRIPACPSEADEDDVAATQALEPETMFGRYRIGRAIGRGGMAIVYLAHDTQLDREVALKIPFFTEQNSDETIRRFYREARAAATIRHPGVCPIYDVGDENGRHYIAMAWIEGRSLSEMLQSDGPMNPELAVTIIRKVAIGLQAAHDCGVVHRDLKPSNIMIDVDGEPILTDFGLARRRGSDDVAVTQVGYFLGTPAYMSPEQVTGDNRQIGFTSDVYSLGVLMYELLTGRRPFDGDVTQVMTDVLTKNPRPPCELKPSIDAELSGICMKAMHKDSSKRYESAAEFANVLSAYPGEGRPSAATDPAADLESDTIAISNTASGRPWSSAKKITLSTILVLAVATTAVVIKSRPTDVNTGNQLGDTLAASGRAAAFAEDRQANQKPKSRTALSARPSDKPVNVATHKITTMPPRQNAKSDVKSLEIHFQRAEDDSTWDILRSDAVPLREGDKIQIHVEMTHPTYVYLYWFDAEGRPTRLWPKSLQQQQMVRELWDHPLAEDPDKQKWHVIGGPVGMESVVVATSETPLAESDLREIEQTKLRIAWLNESGKPVVFRHDPERGLVSTVESPKYPKDVKNLAYLIVPKDSPRRLVLIAPVDQQRALVGTVESPKPPRSFPDFHGTLRARFQSYSGFVLPHDANNNTKR